MKKIVVLLVSLGLCGCAIVTANVYDKNLKFSPTEYSKIGVFKQPLDREFIKIAEVTVDNVNTWSAVEKNLKIKAAELGGDAVYIVDTMSGGRGALSGGSGGFTNIMTVTGVVVKYKENK